MTEEYVNLDEICKKGRAVLKNSSIKDQINFLVSFIEMTDRLEDVEANKDEERIHEYEKDSGLQFEPIVVEKAKEILQNEMKERLAFLRE